MDEIVTPEIYEMVGNSSRPMNAVDEVTTSEIRRWVTATLDDNRLWYDKEYANTTRFGYGCAPGPFVMRSVGPWRRRLGTVDPVRDLGVDDDFRYGYESMDDPAIRIQWPSGVGAFHGGDEVEYFQFARLGDRISATEKIVHIEEKTGKSGPIALVHIDTVYTNQDGDILLIDHRTNVARRMPGRRWRGGLAE